MFTVTIMDALKLDVIPDDCFDLIIDKGIRTNFALCFLYNRILRCYFHVGLFDSQLCSQKNISNVQQLVQEMCRVLRPGGVYLLISHGSPDNRLGYLQRLLPWKVEFKAIPKPRLENQSSEEEEIFRYHYMYICRKNV